jgi:hypothetical protein
MDEKELSPAEDPRTEPEKAEISVNEYGSTKDSAVVIDEANRTVLLTPDETMVFEKEPALNIVPKNRPRYVYAGMWGRNEIATFTLGIFALLTVVIIYVFLVIPSNREVARQRSEVNALDEQLISDKARWGAITSSESQVTNILGSEQQFESNYLRPSSLGTIEIPRRLNSLIAAFGLVNTAGPEYQPLDSVDASVKNNGNDQAAEQSRGRERLKSIFPGMYVTMTVEGSYQNLRRFIRELESGDDFIVISAVQLEPSNNDDGKQAVPEQAPQVAAPVSQPGPNIGPNTYARPGVQPNPQQIDNLRSPADRGKMHGGLVSLHLEMAAYFRRPNFVPTVSQ